MLALILPLKMKGGHGDNYYYQLVANVRRYKGVEPLPRALSPQSIRIEGGMDQWADVGPAFLDEAGDILPRDCDGAGGLHYRDQSGRNDLVVLKVARDANNVYFHARTRQPLKPSSAPNGMWLLLDTDSDPRSGWEGFDFIVNHMVDGDGTTWLEKNVGGWRWKPVAKVSLRVAGNELHLAIPRQSMGIARDQTALSINVVLAYSYTHVCEHGGHRVLCFFHFGNFLAQNCDFLLGQRIVNVGCDLRLGQRIVGVGCDQRVGERDDTGIQTIGRPRILLGADLNVRERLRAHGALGVRRRREFGCVPGTLGPKNVATLALELLQRILQLADSGLKCGPLRHLGLELFPRAAKLLSEPVALVKVILYGLIQGPAKIVDLGMTLVALKTSFLRALGQGGTKLLGVVHGCLQLFGQPL